MLKIIKVLPEMHRNTHFGRLELQCTLITLPTKCSFVSTYSVFRCLTQNQFRHLNNFHRVLNLLLHLFPLVLKIVLAYIKEVGVHCFININ